MAQQAEIEDQNSYQAVPRMVQEKALFHEKTDSVHIEKTRKEPYFLSRIGMLRMHFNVKNKMKIYNGTASVFLVDKNQSLVYAITCAHNLKYVDPISHKVYGASSVFFERRCTIQEGSSQAIKEYEMVYKWIHPQYDPTKFTSPFDIAIIAFKDNDNYFINNENEMDGLSNPELEIEDFTHIFGYPACKRGELWGKSKKANITEDKETNLLQYDIPTEGGQSGSPIIKIHHKYTVNDGEISSTVLSAVLFCLFAVIMSVCRSFGFQYGPSFDLSILMIIIIYVVIYFGVAKIKKECRIIGVHTTGCEEGNIGVKFSKDTLGWIKAKVSDDHETQADITPTGDEQGEISTNYEEGESIGCLKQTPYL